MAIPARLSRTLHTVLGEEGADDLVNWMVRVESHRSELRELMDAWAARTDGRFEMIDGRFDVIDGRFEMIDGRFDVIDSRIVKLEERFAEVDKRFTETNQRIAALSSDILQALGHLEVRIEHRLTDLFKWSFAFWCGAIGVAVLTLILK